MRVSVSAHLANNLVSLIKAILVGEKQHIMGFSICTSLFNNDVKHYSTSFVAMVYALWRMSIQILLPF